MSDPRAMAARKSAPVGRPPEQRAREQRAAAPRSSRWRVATGAALVALAAFAAYEPSLRGAFLIDDNVLLTENPLIKAADGLYRFWLTTEPVDYWPVTNTSLWLEWRLWGMNPAGYHVTNVIVHVACSLLLWAVLGRLAIPGAFFAALLFAVHPVNVESVAWIAQRKNQLAMLFSLLSVLAVLESERRSPSAANRWVCLGLAAFVLAMLSKGSVAVLPVVLLGVLRWLRPLTRRDWVKVAPFFAASAALVVVSMAFQSRFLRPEADSRGLVERLLGAAAAVWFYLYKALLPIELSFVYPRWHVRADRWEWWLPLLAAVAVTGVLWRSRLGRGRPLLFAWGYFCVALAPALGFADVGFMKHSLVADHYQHLALIGVVGLAAAAWGTWQEQTRGQSRWLANAVAVAAAGILALLTWRQSALYADGVTLFRATLERNPESPFAHNNLGLALLGAGRPEEAGAEFERALRLEPGYFEAHYNRARTLSQSGRLEEAIRSYQEAVRLEPDYAEYHYELGAALVRLHRPEEAIEHFRQALRIKPAYPAAHNDLGGALSEMDRMEEAIESYRRALQLDPDFPEAHSNLGRALLGANRLAEAIEHFERAVALAPDLPATQNDLGVALANAGRLDQAIARFQKVLELNPNDPNARDNLEETLAMKRRGMDAKKD